MSKGWKYGIGLGVVILLLLRAICWWGRFRFRLPMFPYPARWRGGEGKLELHSLGIPFAPSADGAALRWRIGCLRTDVADGFQESAGRTIHSGHQRRGKSGSGLRHVAVWRQHHGRGVQSVRLLLRTAWRIYRSHADYGTYPFFSTLIKSNIMLLITGIMIGYIASSAIALLNFFATAEGVQSYMIWGLGNFGGVSLQQMPAFALVTIVGLFGSLLLIKPLNALLLGERYAENLGVNIHRVRNWLLIITGLLTAVTTAFCGPVAFIGLAVPHVARMILGTANHNSLLPVTILSGGAVALLCNLICVLPGEAGIIPLNAVTPIIGAPVIIYVILSQRKPQQFN